MKASLHETLEKISSAATALGQEHDFLGNIQPADFSDVELRERLAALAAQDLPPSNNMGGNLPNTPHFFSHGEKPLVSVNQKTTLDWVAFTVPRELPDLCALVSTIWPDSMFTRNVRGVKGYPESWSITVDGMPFGVFGLGAEHGRNYVSLDGTACKTLTDELVELLFDVLTIPELDARLTRVDICLDLYNGQRTWDHALFAYERGDFKGRKGGRNPQKKVIDVSTGDENLGRTLYIGKRDGAVYGRVYEKGLEVFANLPENLRDLSHARELESGQVSAKADSWLRLEVEYKRRETDLPFAMLLDRDRFFAGAYPYFADALGLTDGRRPVGMKSDFDVDLMKLIHNAKRSYGSLIHSMKELGLSSSEIVEELSTGRNNTKLVKSGLLRELKDTLSAMNIDPDSDIPF